MHGPYRIDIPLHPCIGLSLCREIPEELRGLGMDVHVALVDRHTEPYPPLLQRPTPTFTGEGITVGGAPANSSAIYTGAPVSVGEERYARILTYFFLCRGE